MVCLKISYDCFSPRLSFWNSFGALALLESSLLEVALTDLTLKRKLEQF
jgi:hypothetical protein